MEQCKFNKIIKRYKIGNDIIYALNEVSFSIRSGEMISFVGTSGSGKSTLMNILGFLDIPTSGNYYFDGQDTNKFSENELSKIRNNKIGFVFQSFNLIQNLDAFHNVELPLIYKGVSKIDREKLTIKALKMVGLKDRINHKPFEMSGGQQQRVAIARAIVTDANLILADEPTGNLDSSSSKEIMNILSNLNKLGKTIVIITHDNEIAKQTNRIIKIHDGKIINDTRLYNNE